MRRAQLLLFVIACCHPAIAFVPTVSWKTLSRYGMGLQTGTPARRAASVVIKMDDTSCVEVEAPTLRGEAIAEWRQPRRTVVPSQVLATGVIVCMFACSSAAPRLFALRTTLLHLRLDATAGCCWTHLECLANDMCFGPKPAAGDELNNQWVRRQHVHICARSPFG